MEGNSVVESLLHQTNEVLAGFGGMSVVQLDDERALSLRFSD